MPGLLSWMERSCGSVFGDHRARPAKAVFQADLHEIYSLADVIREGNADVASGLSSQRFGAGTETEVIILGLHRPVIGEGIFDAAADHPARARVISQLKWHASRARVESVVCPSAAALDVEQGLVGCDTDTSGDGCERIGPGVAQQNSRIKQIGAGPLQ